MGEQVPQAALATRTVLSIELSYREDDPLDEATLDRLVAIAGDDAFTAYWSCSWFGATSWSYNGVWVRANGDVTVRDGAEKRYVQHRMWEHRRDLVDWLDNGAHFYVCGATAMGKDVRSTLVRAVADVKALAPDAAEHEVRQLEREHRYQQDVY